MIIRRLLKLFSIILLVLVADADSAADRAVSSLKRDRVAVGERMETRFERVPSEKSGLALVHQFPPEADLHLFQDFGASAGVCTGDIDGDGWPDVFIANYDRGGRLYRNLGDLKFEDVTAESGIVTQGKWCTGVSFVDIENDGDLDLYVCAYRSENLLFLNDGKGRFTEGAASFGLDYNGASIMMSFGDYDLDGFLDAYLVTHRFVDISQSKLPKNTSETLQRGILQQGPKGYGIAPAYRELFGVLNKGGGRMELMIVGQADHLFKNVQGERFQDVSSEAGIRGNEIGLAALWWDYNDDGLPDLYVSNDYKGADKLYQNLGDGTFKNVVIEALPYVPWSSMGTAIGDINNDGFVDLIATDMAGSTHVRRNLIDDDLKRERWFYLATLPKQVRRNTLFLGTGINRVLEVGQLAGLSQSDWTWSPKFGDFDLDGRQDLFVANGMARDFLHGDLLATMRREGNEEWRNYPIHRERDLMFWNRGACHFDEVGQQWGIDSRKASFGATVSDFDRDGDLDLLVTHLEAPVSLFRNDTPHSQRLLVSLQGEKSNHQGIGAKLELKTGDQRQTRYLGSNSGFMSADESIAHFAVEEGIKQGELRVWWPSGVKQHVHVDRFDMRWVIHEKDEMSEPALAEGAHEDSEILFERFPLNPEMVHRENPYDDFSRESLLPARLSNLGPPIAVTDVNRDGKDDFYLGGAIGSPGQLWIQSSEGQFERRKMALRANDRRIEDTDALFLDADSDGDEDLYVVSGGAAYPTGSKGYSDRLYLNDGNGNFRSSADFSLNQKPQSGGVVAAADIDQDGDLDLFVGARSVPGQFGELPVSHLLLNEGGRFVSDSAWAVDEAGRVGMVSGALWSDIDGDGWMDLLVALDWGTIRVWRNRQGRLEEVTSKAGLQTLGGRWRGITAGDLDHDGDMDYLVTNIGENGTVNGNRGQPFGVVVGRLQNTNRRAILELYAKGETVYPLRTRNALFTGIPELAAAYPTYESFSEVTSEEILSLLNLEEARTLRMTTLTTGVLRNNGSGEFRFEALPYQAQISPSFGSVIHDFDGDGQPDLLLGQNATSGSPELGPSRAGMATLLRGHGEGEGGYKWVNPKGMKLPVFDETRSLALLDLNGDRRLDLLFGLNHRPAQAFLNLSGGKRFFIRLEGRPGNLQAVGSRVEIEEIGVRTTVYERNSKSGFASQSSSLISVPLLGEPADAVRIRVRWPRGQTSVQSVPLPHSGVYVIKEPD